MVVVVQRVVGRLEGGVGVRVVVLVVGWVGPDHMTVAVSVAEVPAGMIVTVVRRRGM